MECVGWKFSLSQEKNGWEALATSLPFLLIVVMVLYLESNWETPTSARTSGTEVMGNRVKPGIL